MPELVLIRHGETEWNRERRYQGRQDPPLSEMGEAQANALATRLRHISVDTIFSSNLQRAWNTAKVIAEALKLEVKSEPRLTEIGFGAWEGMTFSEISQANPELVSAWLLDPWQTTPPGGEPMDDFVARTRALLQEFLARHSSETIVLVGHGGSLRTLICLALGIEPRFQWSFQMDNASVSRIRISEDGAVLTLLNDVNHLESTD